MLPESPHAAPNTPSRPRPSPAKSPYRLARRCSTGTRCGHCFACADEDDDEGLEAMTELRSPVKIESPAGRAPLPNPFLPESPLPKSSRPLGSKDVNIMMAATAPAGDRKSKLALGKRGYLDLTSVSKEVDSIATPDKTAPISKSSLFPSIAAHAAAREAHPASDPFPHFAPLPSTSRTTTFPSTSAIDDEASGFFMDGAVTTRRSHSLKHQKSQPAVDVVPSSSSCGSLSIPSLASPIRPSIPQPTFTSTAPSTVSVSSGATLEMLDETASNRSFVPRAPVFEPVQPVASTSAPVRGPVMTRSRAGSLTGPHPALPSRIPVRRPEGDVAKQARKTTSMVDLAGVSKGGKAPTMAQSHPLASSRKRNANGAIVGGGGASSRLANVSPFGPPSSSGIAVSSPSVHAMRDPAPDSDDDEEASPVFHPARPTATRPRSSLPAHLQLGQHSTAHAFSPSPARTGARPLQAAFASTGLVSKRARATDPGPGLLPTNSPFNANPFVPSTTETKPMPDTPCKKTAFLGVSPAVHSPLSPAPASGGIFHRLVRTTSSSSNGSMVSEASPTASRAMTGVRTRISPLFRRRSSGNLGEDAEPGTPTRTTGDFSLGGALPSLLPCSAHADESAGSQLVPSPTSATSNSPESLRNAWPPQPTPGLPPPRSGIPVPKVSLTMTPVQLRVSHPPLSVRPVYQRARHSSGALDTLRTSEMKTPNRLDTDFVTLRTLGSGVASDAWAVQERETGAVWAVKRSKTEYTGPRDRLRRLEEVDILRNLVGHRHIVSFHDAWDQGRHLYIQTELCGAGTLASFLLAYSTQHDAQLDEGRVWKILGEVATGLESTLR